MHYENVGIGDQHWDSRIDLCSKRVEELMNTAQQARSLSKRCKMEG